MSNKRDLKRAINYVCSDLFSECVAVTLYKKEAKEENVEAILSAIINIHHDFLSRISHPEPGTPKKQYFKDLTTSFDNQVAEIIDQINNL